jgi:chromosome segregation ATPase
MAGIAQAQTSPRQEGESLETLKKQFTAELRELRIELLQQGIEFQEWKIKHLERDLQQLQSEQQRLGEQERTFRQQIAELEQNIDNAPPVTEGVGELHVMKDDLTGKRMKDLQAKQQPLFQQEAELREQLKQEQVRLDELLKKVQKLKAESRATQ